MTKKCLSIILSILFVFQLFCLTSCDDPNPSSDDPKEVEGADPEAIFQRGSHIAAISGNTIFFSKKHTQITQNFLDDVQPEAILLVDPNIGTYEDNPFMGMGGNFTFIIEDKAATAANDGMPVLFIMHCYAKQRINQDPGEATRLASRIISFNTGTNMVTIIKDDIEPGVQSFDMYNDTFIYTTNDADEGYNIHCINTDGSNYRKMDNPNKMACRVQTVYKNRIYFIDGATQELFACDFSDFGNLQLISRSSVQVSAFAYDNFIYYSTQRTVELSDGKTQVVADIYRKPIDDLSKEEKVLEGVVTGNLFGHKFYFYHMDNIKFFEYTTLPRPGYEPVVRTAYDGGWSVLYTYDLLSAETETFYDLGDEVKYSVRYPVIVTNEYVVYECVNLNREYLYEVLNRKSGEEYEVPLQIEEYYQ